MNRAIPSPPFKLSKLPPDTVLAVDELAAHYPVFYNENIGQIGFYSDEVINICHKLEKLADYPGIPVLLEGKTGVGKEVFARYCHYTGPRASAPFIGVNCAAIPNALFESELFGYEKGAFTDADAAGKAGKIQLAANGTLFLDEITEIPLTHQSKLLRVLQEREYFQVSGRVKHSVNAAITCATNKNIAQLVKQHLFREDLFYRLNVCKIRIPSLKHRKDEIIPLTLLFLRELNKKNKIPVQGIEAGFLKQLLGYQWPGNIRELKNMLTRISLFNDQGILRADALFPVTVRKTSRILDADHFVIPEKSLDLEKLINNIIIKSLEKFGGNKTKTAAYLHIPRKRLYHKYNPLSGNNE